MTDIKVPARLPDWRRRLTDYVGQVASVPFDPATHHCAYFAAGAVQAMTGVDLARQWRGRARTIAGGLRAIQRAGFLDHVYLVAAYFEEIPAAFAQEGDIAVIGQDGLAALGIVQGPGIYVLRPDGLGVVPLPVAQTAYRVI